jgi:acetyl-CoA carboxylase/biotin carboxylase 1
MERPDPVTGVTREFCVLGDRKDQVCFFDPYARANIIQTKHAIAHRVGSTSYAFDFLGLLEVGLIREWDEYITILIMLISICHLDSFHHKNLLRVKMEN